jgi:hypothetical protein
VKSGSGDGLLATYEDGFKSLQIACAADKSMETGEVISNF